MPEDFEEFPCDACDGSGLSVDGRWLSTLVQLLLIAGAAGVEERPTRGLHPWLRALTLAPKSVRNPMAIAPPTRAMARLTEGLSGRSLAGRSTGHDAVDNHVACKKVALAAGMPEGWGLCLRCEGSGHYYARQG